VREIRNTCKIFENAEGDHVRVDWGMIDLVKLDCKEERCEVVRSIHLTNGSLL
jgi:hypothetical protein